MMMTIKSFTRPQQKWHVRFENTPTLNSPTLLNLRFFLFTNLDVVSDLTALYLCRAFVPRLHGVLFCSSFSLRRPHCPLYDRPPPFTYHTESFLLATKNTAF